MTANPDEDGTKSKDEGEGKGPQPKRKRQPLYLNWQLWLSACVGLILVMIGLALAFGPAAIVATVAAILGGAGLLSKPILDLGSKIFEEIKENRERAEEKALIEGRRYTEIEKKADKAASTAVALAGKVDVNAERTDLLDTRFEILSDMAYQLTENLQQERAESRVVLAELKAQNHEQQQQINRLKEDHRREIAGLKEQIRLMGVEKSSDKEQIILLKSQVKQLQDRVKELEDREGKLTAENEALKEELKIGLRRHATDPLPGLSGEVEERFNRRESDNQE